MEDILGGHFGLVFENKASLECPSSLLSSTVHLSNKVQAETADSQTVVEGRICVVRLSAFHLWGCHPVSLVSSFIMKLVTFVLNVYSLHVCLWTTCMPGARRGQKRALESLELEFVALLKPWSVLMFMTPVTIERLRGWGG